MSKVGTFSGGRSSKLPKIFGNALPKIGNPLPNFFNNFDLFARKMSKSLPNVSYKTGAERTQALRLDKIDHFREVW